MNRNRQNKIEKHIKNIFKDKIFKKMATTDLPQQTMEQYYSQNLSLKVEDETNYISFEGSIPPHIVESDVFLGKTTAYDSVNYSFDIPISRNYRVKIPETNMSWFKWVVVTPLLDNKIKKATLFAKLRVNHLKDEYFPIKTVENVDGFVKFFDKPISCHFPLSVEFEFEQPPPWTYSAKIVFTHYKKSLRVDHQFYNLLSVAGANRPASPKCMSNGIDYSLGKYYIKRTRNGVVIEEREGNLDDSFRLVTNPAIRTSLALLPGMLNPILRF